MFVLPRMISSEKSATFRDHVCASPHDLIRKVRNFSGSCGPCRLPQPCKGRPRHGAPAFVPSSRCQTARFTASTAQHLSFRRRMSASRVLALPFLFCPFACRRISARLTDAAAGLSPSPWRQRPARPDEGRVERRQAHSLALSRLRGATTASRCDRDPSRRSTVAIFGRGPIMVPPPAVGHRRRQRCVGAKPRRLGGRDPGPPGAAVSRRLPRDATPRSAVRIVSGDAPQERGWESL